MSAARLKKRWLAWERYRNRHPRWKAHHGHARAHYQLMVKGRYAPNGVRQPWYLWTSEGR